MRKCFIVCSFLPKQKTAPRGNGSFIQKAKKRVILKLCKQCQGHKDNHSAGFNGFIYRETLKTHGPPRIFICIMILFKLSSRYTAG